MYVFNLFDYQTGGISLLFVGFCEAVFIGWGVGKQQFLNSCIGELLCLSY